MMQQMAQQNTAGTCPVVSVVVPVYNAVPYLRRCVDSIRRQTLSDLEIILVNDGSTDRSSALCRSLAAEDARIRVFDEANGGASRARNTGILHARGQYIGFVDSDDEILPDMYADLVRGAQRLQAQGLRNYIVQIGRREQDEEGNPLPDAVRAPEEDTLVSPEDFIRSLLLYEGDASFCTSLLPAAYMKQFSFREGILGEDFLLLVQMAAEQSSCRMDSLLRLSSCGYVVTHRRGSATRKAGADHFSRVYEDIVHHADYVERDVVPVYPSLALPALRFGLYERLDYLLHVPIADMTKENTFYRDVVAYIRRNRRAMWRSPYLTKKNKLYLTLLGVAPKKTRQIHWMLRKKAILAEQDK